MRFGQAGVFDDTPEGAFGYVSARVDRDSNKVTSRAFEDEVAASLIALPEAKFVEDLEDFRRAQSGQFHEQEGQPLLLV